MTTSKNAIITGITGQDGAYLAQLLLGAAWIPMWFFLNLYLQQVLGFTAFPSGAALLPMTILTMFAMVVLAPQVINRFGAKTPTLARMEK